MGFWGHKTLLRSLHESLSLRLSLHCALLSFWKIYGNYFASLCNVFSDTLVTHTWLVQHLYFACLCLSQSEASYIPAWVENRILSLSYRCRAANDELWTRSIKLMWSTGYKLVAWFLRSNVWSHFLPSNIMGPHRALSTMTSCLELNAAFPAKLIGTFWRVQFRKSSFHWKEDGTITWEHRSFVENIIWLASMRMIVIG